VLLEYEMAVQQLLTNRDYVVPLLLGARRDGAGMLSLWSESEQAWKVCPAPAPSVALLPAMGTVAMAVASRRRAGLVSGRGSPARCSGCTAAASVAVV
jgi:hypothetical protein